MKRVEWTKSGKIGKIWREKNQREHPRCIRDTVWRLNTKMTGSVQAGTYAYTLVIREQRAAYVILGWRWCLETSNSSCYAVVLNSLRNRTGDLTRTRSSVTRSLPWTQARTRARLRSPCGVQTRGSVDGVCIIQECVCRRYGSERRTIVMHMFRTDAMPHTISLPLPLSLVHVRYTLQLRFVSLPFSLTLSLSLSVSTTSFECTPLIFWLLANTDTIEESVVLHAAGTRSCFRGSRPLREGSLSIIASKRSTGSHRISRG